MATLAVAVVLLRGAVPRARASAGEDAARRILVLLSAIGGEYAEGLDESGQVVRPLELDEARLLLGDARAHAGDLGPVAAELEARLAALASAIDAKAPLATVTQQVGSARAFVTQATGVREDLSPAAPPSATRGHEIFAANCTPCHGERGAGDGPSAAELERQPANFTDPRFMRGETPSDHFHVVTVGKRLGAMPAWGDVLSVQQRWDVVSYIWSLRRTAEATAEEQGIFLAHCAGCHGAVGDGRGVYAAGLLTPVADLTAPGGRLGLRPDEDLEKVVAEGIPGTAMPSFARTLSEEERWKAVSYLRLLSLGGLERPGAVQDATAGAPPGTDEAGALADASRLLAAAVQAYERGDAGARDLATDAYFRFEPLEKRIGASDAGLVRRVEEGFIALRTAMQRQATPEVRAAAAAIDRDLAAAGRTLEPTADSYALFLQSATIIMREGFEVVLVIGALLAWVRRSGNATMARRIYLGTGLGVVASVATAVLLRSVLRSRPAAGEILEGVAMLLASAVLFWVSYWIISKAEAERWQRYIRDRVQRAVSSGSGAALAAAAFLAVYREGFETVLFYQALLGSAPAGDVAVPAGLAAGSVGLAIIYVLFLRFGFRIPIRPFFLTTGGLLYTMATSFAGKGVHALQSTGTLAATPVGWAPRFEALGIYPTVESLLAQGVLVLCLLYAVAVTLQRRRSAPAPAEAPVVRAESGRQPEREQRVAGGKGRG